MTAKWCHIRNVLPAVGACLLLASPAAADDLYLSGQPASLAADRRASQLGDTVTVVIVQSAEASSTVRNVSRRSNSLSGSASVGSINESADFGLGSNFDGQGQATRSERFVTQMTARVSQILPNGDLEITGKQQLKINGESTTVEVRGIVRAIDIDAENRVPSNRIADAQINYKGKGFVSRSAKQGLLGQLFTLFGLL
ncbi:MAG: flagellar biosynthesis protein FlgH [Novosphingobium sp.]|nr:flagellar biosynthesis protein FlgH [Novosphingobium sp.]